MPSEFQSEQIRATRYQIRLKCYRKTTETNQERQEVEEDTLVFLDHGLDVLDGSAALDVEGDRFRRERPHEDLHLAGCPW